MTTLSRITVSGQTTDYRDIAISLEFEAYLLPE